MDKLEKKPSKKITYVLGQLDAKTRLTQDTYSYNIEEKKNDIWVTKWYYSNIISALYGYLKILTRAKKDKALPLIDLIIHLDKTIKSVGKRLEHEWRSAPKNVD